MWQDGNVLRADPLIRLPAPSPRWGEETCRDVSTPSSPQRGEGGPKGRMRGRHGTSSRSREPRAPCRFDSAHSHHQRPEVCNFPRASIIGIASE
ncbi:hypothetical protein B5P46_16690 [Rhizobium leguminosarum]|uniref:Uncharacterized protein n=1 Tax=Rhizobium leguminosarum TaxID=384 RepID=A0A4V1P1D1_RHILE|nr:hypothetical protein B5P46_16690 [Rhizobium leguminosarum]